MTRKNRLLLIAIICFVIACIACFMICKEVFAAEAKATSTNENTNSLTLIGPIHQHIPGEQKVTNDVRTSPNVPGLPYLDNPGYFGPFPEQGYNTMEKSILPFLLSQDTGWEVIRDHWWTPSDAKYKLEMITRKTYPRQESVKVINGVQGLKGIKYETVATLVAYKGIKGTTVDCFKEAIYQTSLTGGNVFLLLRAGNVPGVYSRTIGLGGSGAGNFHQGGSAAYSAGTALGFACNNGHPVYSPYIQGVVLLVDDLTYKNLHPNFSLFKEDVKVTKKGLSKGELQSIIKK